MSDNQISAVADRVKAGAILLDEIKPGWFRDIDVVLLDLSSCEDCILGQLFGDYDGFRETMFPLQEGESTQEHADRTYPFMFTHGFCGRTDVTVDKLHLMNEYFHLLKSAWLNEIIVRLK